MEHTKGPWTQDRDGAVVMRGQRTITPANASPDDAEYEEDSANLKLIAAAPDLLEACELALHELENGASHEQRRRIADAIRAAISRATGTE